MYKIDIDNSIESIEINGNVYELDFSSEIMKKFSPDSEYVKDMMRNLSGEALNDFDRAEGLCRSFINGMLKNEPFDTIFKSFEGSMLRVVLLIPKLLEAYRSVAAEAGKVFEEVGSPVKTKAKMKKVKR